MVLGEVGCETSLAFIFLIIGMNTKIFAKTIEEEASLQIQRMSVSDAYHDCQIRIMPDCHAGAGCTIGTVIALKDRVVPNTVGVDIGCGMLVIPILDKDKLSLEELDNYIKNEIPSGFNINSKFLGKEFYSPLILDNYKCQEILDRDFVLKSIGSLGGGNHFIEVDVNDKGQKYLVIHTGSRNLGVRVCKYYQEKAIKYCKSKRTDFTEIIESLKAEGRQSEIQATLTQIKAIQPPFEDDLAYLEGQDLADYLNDMRLCQGYASCNRKALASKILGGAGLFHTLQEYLFHDIGFTTIHNYIDLPHKILRKGSVSALNGEKLIIPINMRDGSLICVGKGNLNWLYSAPHGAGRLMSRKKAKETLKEEDFIESMKGIYTTTATKDTIDEAPMVYKPMDEIIECIKDTVDVVDIIKPIYNFKAAEQ